MKGNIFISRYVMACAISIVIALVGFICIMAANGIVRRLDPDSSLF